MKVLFTRESIEASGFLEVLPQILENPKGFQRLANDLCSPDTAKLVPRAIESWKNALNQKSSDSYSDYH